MEEGEPPQEANNPPNRDVKDRVTDFIAKGNSNMEVQLTHA